MCYVYPGNNDLDINSYGHKIVHSDLDRDLVSNDIPDHLSDHNRNNVDDPDHPADHPGPGVGPGPAPPRSVSFSFPVGDHEQCEALYFRFEASYDVVAVCLTVGLTKRTLSSCLTVYFKLRDKCISHLGRRYLDEFLSTMLTAWLLFFLLVCWGCCELRTYYMSMVS